MKIDIVTVLPGLFEGAFAGGMLRKAIDRNIATIRVVNLRDFADGRHRVTDDYGFGHGPGMIMKPEPIVGAVEALIDEHAGKSRVILMSPQGRRLDQSLCEELAEEEHLILICGRYEGVDERVMELVVDEEISIGDYVLTGGEFPAMVVTDAVVRLLPGVLNQEGAVDSESFSMGLLEGPQYTRPRSYRGLDVPEVLLSGHHEEIRRWQRQEALRRTWERRPDLLQKAKLNDEDRAFLEQLVHKRSD